VKIAKGVSKNSGFSVTCFCAPAKQIYMPSMAISARKHRAGDYMDAVVRRSEGRTIHGAIVENHSVHEVHQERPGSTELMCMDVRYVDFAGAQKSVPPQSRKKCTFSGALKLICLLSLALSTQAFSTLAYSKSGDKQQPIQVEADSLEVRDNDNISVYTGNVKLSQGTLEMQSDQLTLYLADDKTLMLIKMVGSPATFRQLTDRDLEITGEALEMEYRKSESTLLLLDNARLTQGVDVIESNRINLNIDSNTVEAGSAEPDNRIRMLIQPNQPAN
jgi:lipopolysaccharide export system protein LptA